MPPSDEQLLARWRDWLGGPVFQDIMRMFTNRDMWDEQTAVLSGNPHLPRSIYWRFLRITYMDSQALAVRRMVGRGPDERSLRSILKTIAERPELITYERHVASYSSAEHAESYAYDDWLPGRGEPIDGHLNPEVAATALESLDAACNPVRAYANSHVAHSLAKRSEALTFAELHRAVDAVAEAHRVCVLLVRGAAFHYGKPLPPGWSRVFDQPWRAPD